MADRIWTFRRGQHVGRQPRRATVDIGLAIAVSVGLMGAIGLVLAGLGRLALEPPETPLTAENGAEAAAWAGFPDASGLRIRYVDRETQRVDSRTAVWEGSREAIDRLLVAGRFTGEWLTCSDAYISGAGLTVLSECQSGRDEWRRPNGERVVRQVTRGTLSDGTRIVDIRAFMAQPMPSTTH